MAAVRFIISVSLSITVFLSTLCFSQTDEEALLKLKESFTTSELESWVPGSNPCLNKWEGVMCSGETVIGLHLTGLQLSGQVDVDALLQIKALKAVSLINNSFTGPIPELNKLTSLRAIYLSHNQFSGEIPNDYFTAMEKLKKLWLDENKFTGEIPESIMQLANLAELHLESNQFSGTIPPLEKPDVLKSLNLSKNNLEGEIPESFSKFKADSFQGNVGLCGKILGKDCKKGDESGEKKGSNSKSNSSVIIIVVAVLLFLVILGVLLARRRRRDDDFKVLSKEPMKEEVLPVKVQEAESSVKKKPSDSVRRSGSSRKSSAGGGNKGGGGVAELVMVNDEKGEFGMQDLMKASAEVLGNGGMGSAYKAVMANGLSVVVKRMKEMNRIGKEAFEREMRRLGKLRHTNVLTPLAYHFKREEKLIISEYMPRGSLLYVLHGDRGIIHANLNWPTRLKIIKGIAQGLSFIHTEFAAYELPHGNLKSSNVLLTEDYGPLLSDFAFQPLTNPNNVAQGLFAYKSPEYLQSQRVSPKSDVYCLGILILEIITGKFPAQYHSNGKGGIDIVHWVQTSISDNQVEDLIDPDISQTSDSISQMVQLLRIGTNCTESNIGQRLEMKKANDKIQEIN